MDELIHAALCMEAITQEDVDDAMRILRRDGDEESVFIVGEVYGAEVTAGPPLYGCTHSRVYGVLVEDVRDGQITFRYVTDRFITQGPLRWMYPDAVIDAVMEADGPSAGDWVARDEARMAAVLEGDRESFVDVGEDECVTFCA